MNNQIRNILYVFNDTSLGGAAQSLLDTLEEIRKSVNPIVAMRETVQDTVREKFENLGIHCYSIRFSTDYVKIGNITQERKEAEFKKSYEAALEILQIIREEKIELIHINSSTSYFAAIAALMVEVPYVWHIRELMEEQFGWEFLDSELKQKLYSQSDKLIAVSHYVKQKYQEKYSIDTCKIYDGLEIERYKLDIDEDIEFENVFLVAAVVSGGKGQLDAIKAVEILINKGYPDIKLIIVGGGADKYKWVLRKYLKDRKLDKNIYILPFQDDLSGLRKKVSYAITCSRNEALGRVTIEAMLAGNLVIGAKSGGTTEIIGENEERGFLYELHNYEDLANAMIRAMKCPRDEKVKMITNAQTYVEKKFNSENYCIELLNIYDEAISFFKPKNADEFLNELKERYEIVKKEIASGQKVFNNQEVKVQAEFELAVRWLEIKQKGYNLQAYFKRHNFYSVAIYGMAVLGCRLYDELENSDITIKYLIDKNPDGMEKVLTLTSLYGDMLEVDVIVVTVVGTERQIVREIQNRGYENVIGLSDILNDFP